MVIIKLRQGYTRVFDGKVGSEEAQWDKNSPWVLHQEIMIEIDIESTNKEPQHSILFGNMEDNSHKTQLKELKMVPYGVQDLGDVGREGRQSCLVICLPHYATQIKWKCCKMWFLFQIRALSSHRHLQKFIQKNQTGHVCWLLCNKNRQWEG